MKKIAFFVAGVNAGGTENYLLRFIKYYQNGLDATVYCKSGKLGELEQEFIDAGATLIPFYLGYFNYKNYCALQKEFKKEKYDAVCDLTGSFGAFPLLMAKKAGIIKRIAFFRNSREKFQRTFLKVLYNNIITRMLPKVATSILSNSNNALNYFYGHKWESNDQFEVIYNGIDSKNFLTNFNNLRDELNIPTSAFVVGHVGRLNEQKNHSTMINVALALTKEDQNIYFVFCGKNVGEKYNDLILSEGLSDRILFLGVRRDINRVLKTLNCFYFPSFIEGQPNALIEALMVGLPFVASDIEPIKETVPDKFFGQLIHPLDEQGAKNRITEIKNNPEKISELNLSEWAIDYYNPAKWFQLFYNKL